MAIETTPEESYEGNGSPRRGGGLPGLGLIKGLIVTLKHLLSRSITQQYPHVKPDLPPRTRGVIALKPENCTVCWKCSRECPDWCIYIESHKETHQPASGGRARSAKVLDRFAIDYALCMYCGICVEVCPFDALFWSPEFEYATYSIQELTHEKEKLDDWTYTVLPPPELEEGAEPEAEPAEVPAEPPTSATPIASPGAESEGAPAQAETASAAPSVARGAPSGATSAAPPGSAEASPEATPLVAEGGADAAKSEGGAEAAQSPAQAPEAPAAEHVEPDQETYERVLKEELDKGTDRRVAEGRAKAAGVRAARRKAQGAGA
jgi:formate hydrogenlyase subunit 6/NADH:ubiquinone oxidoreductase subunit I